jgi:hypothetical protein
MSHNIHYARIYAGSPEDACGMVECNIADFGDENNWRSIVGSIDKTGNFYINDNDGRWDLPNSWQEIEDQIKEEFAPDAWTKENFDRSMAKLQGGEVLTETDWYYIRKYAEHMEDTICLPTFSLEARSQLREYEYDEFGITNFDQENQDGIEYIVMIDMHS